LRLISTLFARFINGNSNWHATLILLATTPCPRHVTVIH